LHLLLVYIILATESSPTYNVIVRITRGFLAPRAVAGVGSHSSKGGRFS
jgi:hypothetical protein